MYRIFKNLGLEPCKLATDIRGDIRPTCECCKTMTFPLLLNNIRVLPLNTTSKARMISLASQVRKTVHNKTLHGRCKVSSHSGCCCPRCWITFAFISENKKSAWASSMSTFMSLDLFPSLCKVHCKVVRCWCIDFAVFVVHVTSLSLSQLICEVGHAIQFCQVFAEVRRVMRYSTPLETPLKILTHLHAWCCLIQNPPFL